MSLNQQASRDEEASAIYQSHLDVSTKLVFEGDVEGFAEHVTLPYVFLTAAGEDVAETREELLGDLRNIHSWLTIQGATDYYRIVHKARFLEEDAIEGTHVSYVLRGAMAVTEPYRSRMVLRRIEGHWRAAYSEHELADALFPARDTRPRPGIFLKKDGFGAEPVIHDTDRALPIYQAAIDAMSAATNADDFEEWIRHFTDPYDIHYEGSDFYSKSPNATRPFFDAIRTTMAECGDAPLVREAHFAAFLSPDRLLGYHQSTMRKDGEVRFGPIQSRMILTLENDIWKCRAVTNSLANTDVKGGSFKLSDHLPTMREINERNKK